MADDDREIFDSALSDEVTAEPPEQTAEPEPQQAEQTNGQPRDEHGRFAPKQKEAEAEQPAETASTQPSADTQPEQPRQDDAGHVPAWRLREEAEAKRALERERDELRRQFETLQMQVRQFQQAQQQQQQQPEPVDIFSDPDAYHRRITETFDERLRRQEINFSFRLAHMQYKDEFDAAYAAAMEARDRGDVATVQSIVGSSDPGEALIRWHRQQKLYAATNGDLEGFLTKKQEELLNDPAFLAKAAEKIRAQAGNGAAPGQRPAPVVQMPPSLNRATSAASSVDGDADLSDAGIFAQAIR